MCLIVIPPPTQLTNFLIFFHSEHSFSTPLLCLLIIGESFQPDFERIYLCWLFCDLAKGVTRLYCVLFCKFVRQLLTSFHRSSQMFVDVFIECVAWSYWWTWCVLPIICNSKHFSFFVFYFNVSNFPPPNCGY